jgi:NAD(P)-dependent dehydrogenase (short-subunit alcohol dehydrogenase family)
MADRAVLITGASRGIGRATAQAFAAAGDRVAVNYRESAGLAEELVASLPGSGHLAIKADVADPDQARALVESSVKGLGGLDVLVNNAGISVPNPITEPNFQTWLSAWELTMAVNLSGTAYVTYWAVQQMLGHGGRIIKISSRTVPARRV